MPKLIRLGRSRYGGLSVIDACSLQTRIEREGVMAIMDLSNWTK
ncbi:MAG: hypothetical protein ABWJ97_00680 [Thermoproteus sp.]